MILRSFFGSAANNVMGDRHQVIVRQLHEIDSAAVAVHQHDAGGHVRRAHQGRPLLHR